jgi:phospholipid/cholesterol/gamma-HCH transport system permease protein
MPAIRYWVDEVGSCLIYMDLLLTTWRKHGLSYKLLIEQIWRVFTQSFTTTTMSGVFVGAIMTVQFTMQIKMFGAQGYLGALSTSSVVREVGPLLIAFMLSGKVGAYTSAELGSMKITEQIDAIRCLGANPITEIILPRFVGIIIAAFFLLVYGIIFAFLGGLIMGYVFTGVSFDEYIRNIPQFLTGISIAGGVIKALSFAFVIAVLCTFYGYNTTGGAKNVGRAVVRTSVSTMLIIVIMDWFTSLLLETFGEMFL